MPSWRFGSDLYRRAFAIEGAADIFSVYGSLFSMTIEACKLALPAAEISPPQTGQFACVWSRKKAVGPAATTTLARARHLPDIHTENTKNHY